MKVYKKARKEKIDLNFLQIKNETDTSADVYIYGDIVDDYWADWLGSGYVAPTQIKDQLESLDGKALNVYINSDGGMVNAGLAIANILARHNGPTVGIVDGWAASIASVILMACDKIQMPENTFLMIHKPASGVMGNADDMRQLADVLDVLQQGMMSSYTKHMIDGVSADDIQADMDAETWYTAEQAAEKFDIEVMPMKEQAIACAGTSYTSFLKIPDSVKVAVLDKKKEKEPVLPATKSREDIEKEAKIASELLQKKGFIAAVLRESEAI